MSSGKFRLLIVPEEDGEVRQLQLHPGIFRALLVASLLLAAAVALLAADYFRVRSYHDEILRLRSENRVFQEEIRRLGTEMMSLRQDLAIQARYDPRFRIMAQLPVRLKNSPNGIGGPTEPDTPEAAGQLQSQSDNLRLANDLQTPGEAEKPSGWPTHGWLSSLFGMRQSPFSGRQVFHEGIDIAARAGTPVHATAGGTVVRAGYNSGYGNLVVIDHGNGYHTLYGHNAKVFVKVGQKIAKGEKIATVGNTGRSTGPHLHYEVHHKGSPVNPRKFL